MSDVNEDVAPNGDDVQTETDVPPPDVPPVEETAQEPEEEG